MINFSIELEELSDVMLQYPHGVFLYNRESLASVLVIMFTNKPHMSVIFHIARHPSWENIQMDE